MRRLAAGLVLAAVVLPSWAAPARAASACAGGLTLAGIDDFSMRRYDGVTARVKATSRFAGLNGKFDSVTGVVGIGETGRSYAAVSLGSHVDGNRVTPSYEFRQGGVFNHVPLGDLPSRTPWMVGYVHSLRIERDPGSARWSVLLDGIEVAKLSLDGTSEGMAHPHVLLSVRNTSGRCDNRGTLLFSQVHVKDSTTGAWIPLEGRAAIQANRSGTGIREEWLSPTSFAVGTNVSAHEFWTYWLRLYGIWFAGGLVAAFAAVMFWTRRSYWRDVRLSARVFLAVLFLVALYLPVAMLPVYWVFARSSLFDAGLMLAVEVALALAAPYYAARLVLRNACARPLAREESPNAFSAVERICALANLPPPALATTDASATYAFTTGAGRHATIVLSRGLLECLDPEELEAVIAHELAHIANGDAFALTALSFPALALGRALAFPFRARPLTTKIVASLICLVIFWWLIGPVWILWALAMLVMFRLSRYREYVADRTAARLTGGPKALMSALVHIADRLEQIPSRDLRESDGAFAAFLIVPATREGWSFTLDASRLFSSHPPLWQRLTALSDGRPLSTAVQRPPSTRISAVWKENPLALISVGCALPVLAVFADFRQSWGSSGSAAVVAALGSLFGSVAAFNGVGRAQTGAPGRFLASAALAVCLVIPLSFALGAFTGAAAALLHPFSLPH